MFVDEKHIAPLAVPILEPWQKALLNGAELIDRFGLAKGIRENAEGSLCVHGAMSLAATGNVMSDNEASFKAALRLHAHLSTTRGYCDYPGNCASWNNRPERTKDEVISAMREVANVR